MLDRLKLIKILNLATTPEPFECIAAFRRANQLVYDAGTTWFELLSNIPTKTKCLDCAEKDTLIAEYKAAMKRNAPDTTDNSEIGRMLTAIEDDAGYQGNDFIESLRAQFTENKFLSPKQVVALRKFYNNLRD